MESESSRLQLWKAQMQSRKFAAAAQSPQKKGQSERSATKQLVRLSNEVWRLFNLDLVDLVVLPVSALGLCSYSAFILQVPKRRARQADWQLWTVRGWWSLNGIWKCANYWIRTIDCVPSIDFMVSGILSFQFGFKPTDSIFGCVGATGSEQ